MNDVKLAKNIKGQQKKIHQKIVDISTNLEPLLESYHKELDRLGNKSFQRKK